MDASAPRAFLLLAATCVLATLGLGIGKVFYQREHLPAYASPTHNTYEGFVSLDQYCVRAEAFRDVFFATDAQRSGAREELAHDLRRRGHPTAILVPALVAALSPVCGSIPITFLILSALAFVLTVLCTARVALSMGGGVTCAAVAAILVAAHVDSARSAAQLLLDPFAALAGILTVLLALRRQAGPPSRARDLALFAVCVAGTFVKLTYFPLLLAPACLALAQGGSQRVRRGLRDLVLFGVLPAVPAALYVLVVPGLGGFGAEMDQAADSSSLSRAELLNFLIEMALLLQVHPLLAWWGRRSDPRSRALAATAAILIASLWSWNLPDDHRLYLPAVAVLAAAHAPVAVARLGPRSLFAWLLAWALGNYAVALVGLLA